MAERKIAIISTSTSPEVGSGPQGVIGEAPNMAEFEAFLRKWFTSGHDSADPADLLTDAKVKFEYPDRSLPKEYHLTIDFKRTRDAVRFINALLLAAMVRPAVMDWLYVNLETPRRIYMGVFRETGRGMESAD